MNNELIKELKKCLYYKNGKLFWKKTLGTRAIKNNRSGCLNKSTGYWNISIYGFYFSEHRIIWAFHYGEIKKGEIIHHIDKNKINNNILNLEKILNRDHNIFHKNKISKINKLNLLKKQIENLKKKKKDLHLPIP